MSTALGLEIGVPEMRRGNTSYWLSDSFARADSETLGIVDGLGDAAFLGGLSKTWANVVGSWAIVSNTAKGTLDTGTAIAVVNTDRADVIVRATATRVGGVWGVILRRANNTPGAASNYIRVWHDGTNVRCDKVLNGVGTTILANTAVAAGELVVIARGTEIIIYSAGILVGTVTIADAVLQAGTYCGLLTTNANNAFTAFGVRPANSGAILRLNRADANTFNFRIPLTGAARDIVQNFQMLKYTAVPSGWGFAPETWNLYGATVVDLVGSATTVILGQSGSAYEYSYYIGMTDAATEDFVNYGSLHGAEKSSGSYVVIDGHTTSLASIANGRTMYGTSIRFVETNEIYLSDKTTICGSVYRQYDLESTSLLLSHNHNYNSGLQIHTAYSAMLPTTNANSAGVDTYKVGDNDEAARAFDNGAKNRPTETDTMYGRHSSAHSYKITMTLPDGGPDVNGDWSKSGAFKSWFSDLAPDPSGVGKFYVNWVASSYANRVNAVNSQHRTRYKIEIVS